MLHISYLCSENCEDDRQRPDPHHDVSNGLAMASSSCGGCGGAPFGNSGRDEVTARLARGTFLRVTGLEIANSAVSLT